MKKYIKIFILCFIFISIVFTATISNASGIDGTTIVINPGHGGEWTGCANGAKNIVEKDVTLKIANYLKTELEKYYDVKVILTHDGVNFPKNDAGDLAARAMVARNNKAELYVSLHIDDCNDKSVQGASVYTTSRTELPKYKQGMRDLAGKILTNLNSLGIKTSPLGIVSDRLCNDHEPKFQYYDGSQADYYGDIRYCMKGDTDGLGPNFSDGSGVPAVLIEHCYMNNAHDAEFLDSNEDLQKLAKADANAIIDYLGLKLKGTVIDTLKIDKDSANLIVGNSQKINIIEIGPSTVANKSVTWKSSNTSIATVDNNGNITAVTEGNATITVTSDDNKNISKTVAVKVEKEEVKITDNTVYTLAGREKQLSYKITPSWIQNKNITWKSSNPSIATVDNTGKIKAIAEGKTTITLTWTDKSLSDSIEINVIKLADGTNYEVKNYTEKDNKISKIGPNITIENFLKNIQVTDNLKVTVTPANENQTLIGTGTKATISEKEHGIVLEEYECIVYGDINGDGNITPADYVKIKNHIMNVNKLQNVYKTAADVSRDGNITPADYVRVKNHIMKVSEIEK